MAAPGQNFDGVVGNVELDPVPVELDRQIAGTAMRDIEIIAKALLDARTELARHRDWPPIDADAWQFPGSFHGIPRVLEPFSSDCAIMPIAGEQHPDEPDRIVLISMPNELAVEVRAAFQELLRPLSETAFTFDRRSYMGHMDLHCWRVLHVEDFATVAFPETAGRPARAIIRRLQLFAGSPQRVFPRGMGVVVPPCLKILRRAFRQIVPPGLFEGIARQVEGCRGAVSIVAGTAAGIEPARPRPCVGVGRITGALGDHPDPHAIVKDEPAFIRGSWIAAANEFGHDAHSSAVEA
jgi:hypothetical protein